MVQWGIEMSGATGLPCYLQASEQGRRLYSHYGFENLSTVEFDLARCGLIGVERMTEMIRHPANTAHGWTAETQKADSSAIKNLYT